MATNNTNRPADKATLTRNPEGWRYRSTVNNGIPWNETTLELSHGATDYELEIAAGEAFPSDKGIPLTIDRPKTPAQISTRLDRIPSMVLRDILVGANIEPGPGYDDWRAQAVESFDLLGIADLILEIAADGSLSVSCGGVPQCEILVAEIEPMITETEGRAIADQAVRLFRSEFSLGFDRVEVR